MNQEDQIQSGESTRKSSLTRFSFNGDALEVIPQDGRLWIVVRRVCEALGIDNKGQYAKLSSKKWAVVEMISTTASDGKTYGMLCIDLDSLPMWLATIDPARVREDIRPKLEVYQRECARVLRDHFFGPKIDPAIVTKVDQALARIEAVHDALTVRVESNEAATRRAVAVAMQAEAKADDALMEVTAEREAADDFVAWARGRRFPTGLAGAAFGASVCKMIRDIATLEGSRLGVKPERLWAGINTALRNDVHLAMGEQWAELPVEMMAHVMGYLRRRLRRAQRAFDGGQSPQMPLFRRRRRPAA